MKCPHVAENAALLLPKTFLISDYTFDARIGKLLETQQGWQQYYRMASIQGKLKDVDGWVRNRLRCCISKQWKKPGRRRKNLMRLGVDLEQAYSHSRSRVGIWAVACSPVLKTTITVECLQQRGYESLFNYYRKIAPSLNEPLYTRTVRTVAG